MGRPLWSFTMAFSWGAFGYLCTETKNGHLVYSNSPLGGTVVIRILRFFVALYLLFRPSHRYRTKQNRSCQLLLNVKMQYGCFTQCQKRIKSLISFKVSVHILQSECSYPSKRVFISFKVSVLLAELYVKYKLISDVVK
jgi:hypothetical protein